jgi:hypothetical protein
MKKSQQYSTIKPFKIIDRDIIVALNAFFLDKEVLKDLFWNIAKVEYLPTPQAIKIGITVDGNKQGTVLEKMRKLAKPVADMLYTTKLLNNKPKVLFSIHEVGRDVLSIIEEIESQNLENNPKETIEPSQD